MSETNKSSVRIRMYRQGLGDCFLLTFSEHGKDEFNMLIDCGLLRGTPNGSKIMEQVAADIEATLPQKKLNAVVLTHEHADHISGFADAEEVFKRIEFTQVWTAWMDDEHHPKYKLVRERFRKQIMGLNNARAKMTDKQQQDMKLAIDHLLDDFFLSDVLGAKDNKKGRSRAWEIAFQKSTKPVKFLSPGTMFPLPGFDDIRIYVLGPSEDFESFTKVNPPEEDTYRSEGSGFAAMNSFLAAVAEGGDALSTNSFQPFEERLRIPRNEAEKKAFFMNHYFAPEDDSWRQIENDWLSVAGGLALHLDNYTNNTCVALAIEFVSSQKVLLFPGDAQFSNWLSWQKLSWQVTDNAGVKQKVTTKDLLERTVFYKVGHHGSHNATLKKHGLEMMNSDDLIAMIPVDRVQAKNQGSKGWQMPEKNLFERLNQRTRGRIILADEQDHTALEKRCGDKEFVQKVKFGGSLVRSASADAQPERLYVELTISS